MSEISDLPPVERWGVSAPLVPLGGGHRNKVIRAGDLVSKSTRRSASAIDWLLDVQEHARQAGFDVPRLRRRTQGRHIEAGWTCEPFVEGTPLSHAALPAICQPILDFQTATREIAQRPGFLSSTELLEAAAGGDVDLGRMPAALVETCRAAWRAVAARPCTVVHGDLNPSNLLKTRNGGIALIDWDECRRDLALYDLGQLTPDDPAGQRARLAWEIACCWRVEPDPARRLAASL